MAVVTDEPPSGPVGFRQRFEVAYEVVVTSIVRGGHGIELMGHSLHSPTQEAGGALGLAIQEEHGDLCVETMTKRGVLLRDLFISQASKRCDSRRLSGFWRGQAGSPVPDQCHGSSSVPSRHKDFFHDELDRSTRNLGSCSYVEAPVLPLMSSTPQGRLSELLALKWDERGELHAIDKVNLLQVLKKVLTDEFFSSSLSTAPPPSESRDV